MRNIKPRFKRTLTFIIISTHTKCTYTHLSGRSIKSVKLCLKKWKVGTERKKVKQKAKKAKKKPKKESHLQYIWPYKTYTHTSQIYTLRLMLHVMMHSIWKWQKYKFMLKNIGANIFGEGSYWKGWQVNANFMFFCLACFLFAFLVVSRTTLHFTKSIGFYTKSTPASPPPAVAVAVASVPHIVFDCGLCSSTRA